MNIKFATFNLYQFCKPPYSFYFRKDKFKEQDWQVKFSWIKSQIKKMDADIIGFQEVFSISELENLTKELGYNYFITVDSPKLEKDTIYTTTVLALASKYKIEEIIKVKHRKSFKFARIPIKAKISIDDKNSFLVYVAHFKSNRLNEFEYPFKKETTLKEKFEKQEISLKNGFSKSLEQRLNEAKYLFNDIKNESLDKVFLCDLNDKEFSLTYEALTNSSYYTKNFNKDELVLIDAYYEHKIEVYNPHPEFKGIKRVPTSFFQGKGNVLDYILISPNLKEKVENYKVLDEELKKNPAGSLKSSDHAQVVCEINFN